MINLRDDYSDAIAKALGANTTLKSLSFIDSSIEPKVGMSLVDYFATSRSLEFFFMTQTKLCNNAVCAFASALDTTTVKFLNLSGVSIGNICSCFFAQQLDSNRTVKGISLFDCGIGNEGAIELCKAIRFNPVIEVFNIAGNPFDEKAKNVIANILPEMFHSNYNITRPNLDNLMVFSRAAVDFPILSYIAQDYIDITLNSFQQTNENEEKEKESEERGKESEEKEGKGGTVVNEEGRESGGESEESEESL
jgi:Ran GTPase-activating protein (RanGAP) involved in mRNA processing and transport